MSDIDTDHAAALDAFAAQDASGFGQEAPPYTPPLCDECGAELTAQDHDVDGRCVAFLACETCSAAESTQVEKEQR